MNIFTFTWKLRIYLLQNVIFFCKSLCRFYKQRRTRVSEIEWLTSVLRERRKREIYKGARKRGGNRGGKKTLKWPPAEIDRCITLLQRVSREKFGVNFLLDTALCTRCSRVLCNKFIQTDFLFVVNVLVQKAFGLSDINCITLNKPANIYVPRNKSSIHLAVGISCEKKFYFFNFT